MPKKSTKIFLYPDNNYKAKEILMPSELIEQIFDNNRLLWHETTEEQLYRERKEQYNKDLIKKVFDLKFTEKQRTVLNLVFIRGLTLLETGKILGVTPQDIMNTKKMIIKKVKKRLKYDFELV